MKFLVFLLALCTASFALADDTGVGPIPTNSTLLAPGPIGSTTPNTGAFTTLTATGLTVTESATGTLSWSDSATTTQPYALTLNHTSSGTPAAGFGTSLLMTAKSSTTAGREQFEILNSWNSATDASRTTITQFRTWDTAAREGIRIQSDGAAARLGFFGATAVVQQASSVDADTALVNLGFKAASGFRARKIARVYTGVNMNSANTDVQSITGLPAKYRISTLRAFDASISLTTATMDFRDAASGGGNAMVNAYALSGCTSATKWVSPTLASAALTDYLTASTLYIRNVTAQGATATVSFILEIDDLTP